MANGQGLNPYSDDAAYQEASNCPLQPYADPRAYHHHQLCGRSSASQRFRAWDLALRATALLLIAGAVVACCCLAGCRSAPETGAAAVQSLTLDQQPDGDASAAQNTWTLGGFDSIGCEEATPITAAGTRSSECFSNGGAVFNSYTFYQQQPQAGDWSVCRYSTATCTGASSQSPFGGCRDIPGDYYNVRSLRVVPSNQECP